MVQLFSLSDEKVTVAAGSPGELFSFRTWVHEAGYDITPAGSEGLRVGLTSELLTGPFAGEILPLGVEAKPHYPLRESENIAREFAKVGNSEADVIAFVNRHGLLSTRLNTFESFCRRRDGVRDVIKKIDAIKNRPDGAHAYEKRSLLRELAGWFNRTAAESFTYRLRLPTAEDTDRAIRVVPESLYSAIGLLLAHEISGAIEWRRCANEDCAKWFPSGAPGDRVRSRLARTCSDECAHTINEARKAERRAAEAPVFEPRKCFHCGEIFQPKRATTAHCGMSPCRQAFHRIKAAKQTRKGASI